MLLVSMAATFSIKFTQESSHRILSVTSVDGMAEYFNELQSIPRSPTLELLPGRPLVPPKAHFRLEIQEYEFEISGLIGKDVRERASCRASPLWLARAVSRVFEFRRVP